MDRAEQTRQAKTRKRGRRHNDNERALAANTNLQLAAGTDIVPVFFRDRPLFAALATEDACWQFAVADWRAREPSVWQFADRRTWRDEGLALIEKRTRIREVAAELGLPLADMRTNPFRPYDPQP
jgi:hypothetical protein